MAKSASSPGAIGLPAASLAPSPSSMSRPLPGARVVVLAGDDYEDLELWYPKLRLEEAGAVVTLASRDEPRTFLGKHGYPCRSDATVAGLRAEDFYGIILPGGWMPDALRRDGHVLALVRDCAAAGKLVAAICHGGWIAISAGVYRGVRVTGSPGIKDDLVNAGAVFEDAEVVVDRHFVSSRRPSDLPAFMAAVIEVLADSPRGGDR
jgi:protease I